MIRLGRKTGGLLAVLAIALAAPVFLSSKAEAISNILPELSAQGDASSLVIGRLANGNTMPTEKTYGQTDICEHTGPGAGVRRSVLQHRI
jgi:hypothetical protein